MMVRSGAPEARNPIAPGLPRRYSARVLSERIEYLSIDSDMLDVMLTWDQTGSYEVNELKQNEEAASDDWMTTLLQTKALHRIPPANIQAIFMRMQRVDYKAGESVIKQGDEGDYFYVIVKGKCVVIRETPLNKEGIRLAELGMGDTFGEEALISDARRNANVSMLTDGTLMRLGKEDFRKLLNEPLLERVDLTCESHRGERRAMAGRASAERVRQLSHGRRVEPAALFHPPEAEITRSQRPLRGVLRHGPKKLSGRLHPFGARFSCVGAGRRAALGGHDQEVTDPLVTHYGSHITYIVCVGLSPPSAPAR